MGSIPVDFNKLIELYNSLGLSTDPKDLTTSNIVNSLIYNNKVLNEEALNKLSKIKSLTYDNEELKKLIVSQQIKNYLIQELLKAFLKKDSLTQPKSSTEIVKKVQDLFNRNTEYYDKQNELFDKIEQVISSFREIKVKYCK